MNFYIYIKFNVYLLNILKYVGESLQLPLFQFTLTPYRISVTIRDTNNYMYTLTVITVINVM